MLLYVHVHVCNLFFIQLLHDECHENQELEGGAVRQLVGRSSHTFQHLVSRGAGTVSQLVGQK